MEETEKETPFPHAGRALHLARARLRGALGSCHRRWSVGGPRAASGAEGSAGASSADPREDSLAPVPAGEWLLAAPRVLIQVLAHIRDRLGTNSIWVLLK